MGASGPITKSQRVTNGAGTVTSTIDLDPWGGETNRSSNQAFQPHRFTSYERDANSGDEAMFRRYQVNWTRFSQPDPYDGSYSLWDPQSFNRYSYVQNDPVNFVDPTGLMTCYIDGTVAPCSTAYGLARAGAGVPGPLNTTRWNPNARGGQGQFEFFHATAQGSGWIPRGARYIGGLSWGWTDYSREGAPSYTYSFTEHRLSQLIYWARRFAFEFNGIIRNVYGDVIGERGLDPPLIDPIWIAAGLGAGLIRGGMRGAVAQTSTRQITLQTGHIMRHFAGTGLTEAQVSAALRQSVQMATRNVQVTGSFWGRFRLNGILVEYRAYTLPNGTINVGTAFPWPKY